MKRIIVLVCVVGLAACGGGGASSSSVAVGVINDALAGRYGAMFDRFAPAVQATTTREAFTSCVVAKGTTGLANTTVKAVETSKGANFTKADGSVIRSDSVTVNVVAGTQSENLVVWVVDGKVAAIDLKSDPSSKSCVRRL